MATANSKVKFVYTTATAYANLQATDPNTIYFLADTQQIFLGSINYAPSEPYATDNVAGTIKTNSDVGISTDSNGKLQISGLMGNTNANSGLYYPITLTPESVGRNSILISDATGINLTNRSFSIVAGTDITLKSTAAAGSTTYTVADTYDNRFLCVLAINGYLTLNESTAPSYVSKITSIMKGDQTPSLDFNVQPIDTTPITITVDESANPDIAANKLRLYGDMSGGYCNIIVGQCMASRSGNRSVVVGQYIDSEAPQSVLIGARLYNSATSSALFGQKLINTKPYSLLSGLGHDSTNGPINGVVAVGRWSEITSNTQFAVGDGIDKDSRSNSFEILDSGGIVLTAPNGSKWKVNVDDTGNLVTTSYTS